MNILLGLIPAIAWGTIPLVTRKLGSKAVNQCLGVAFGAVLVGLGIFVLARPVAGLEAFLFCMASGACWALGFFLQYISFDYIGVSMAMPLSTGMQLVATSLAGVLLFGEWPTWHARALGALAVALIIAGAALTIWREKKDGTQKKNLPKALLLLLVSSLGFTAYSVLPRFTQVDEWGKFLPQAAGMLVFALCVALASTKGKALAEGASYRNMVTGFIFSVGGVVYLLSVQLNGVATGFALSQMSVVISTLGGIVFLGEKKTKKEMLAVLLGLALVAGGGVVISFVK